MDQKRVEREAATEPPANAAVDTMPIIIARTLLSAFLQEQVAARLLDELDERILSLRLGLADGHCYTLEETGALVHRSPEVIRRRQYLSLKKAMKDLRFFKLFRDYAHLVHLPKGVTYYLYKYSDYTDTF